MVIGVQGCARRLEHFREGCVSVENPSPAVLEQTPHSPPGEGARIPNAGASNHGVVKSFLEFQQLKERHPPRYPGGGTQRNRRESTVAGYRCWRCPTLLEPWSSRVQGWFPALDTEAPDQTLGHYRNEAVRQQAGFDAHVEETEWRPGHRWCGGWRTRGGR